MRYLSKNNHDRLNIGGAYLQTHLLGNKLHRRDHEVTIATVWQPRLSEHEDIDGIQVYRLRQIHTMLTRNIADHIQRHRPPFPDPVTVVGLRRLIQELEPDVHGRKYYSSIREHLPAAH
jgi:hypothetical protein